MRTLLGFTLAAAFCGGLGADDKKDEKIDAKKLVGKWEQQKDKESSRTSFEFTSEGKVTMWTKSSEEATAIKGTYKVDGSVLRMELLIQLPKGTLNSDTNLTILKLTEADLEIDHFQQEVMKFKRVKDKR